MNRQEAEDLARRVAVLVRSKTRIPEEAHTLLSPALVGRTPFPLLDRIGEVIGSGPLRAVTAFLDRIAAGRATGGWVVVGSALRAQLDRDCAGALARCRSFVAAADVWYGADILGERVPGPALVTAFDRSLPLLADWRDDANPWVRRTVGVGVHFWSKRSRGDRASIVCARKLLALLEPMFEEGDQHAVKGVAWGLKTLGRYFPDLVTGWLAKQVRHRKRNPRPLMLRKAMTHLSEEQRVRIVGATD